MAKRIQQPYERGVVIDQRGQIVTAWQWEPGNTPRSPANSGYKLLTDPDALDPPSMDARWDAQARTWVTPPLQLWVVDRLGQPHGKRQCWPDAIPPLQPGWAYVDEAPPVWEHQRPIFDPDTGQWRAPRRVFVGCAHTHICVDVLLENPRSDTEDVTLGPDLIRLGDDDNGHPVDVDGDPVVPMEHIRAPNGEWRNLRRAVFDVDTLDLATGGVLTGRLASNGRAAAQLPGTDADAILAIIESRLPPDEIIRLGFADR